MWPVGWRPKLGGIVNPAPWLKRSLAWLWRWEEPRARRSVRAQLQAGMWSAQILALEDCWKPCPPALYLISGDRVLVDSPSVHVRQELSGPLGNTAEVDAHLGFYFPTGEAIGPGNSSPMGGLLPILAWGQGDLVHYGNLTSNPFCKDLLSLCD